MQLAEEAEPYLDGPQQVVWLERLEREYDNIRTALRWSREQGGMRGNWETALRLAIALRRFWMMRGYWNEGRRFFEQALAESIGVVGPLRARALSAAATLADYQGDYRRGETLCQESLAIWKALQDMRGMAFSLYRLASMSSERGNFSLARSLYEEALELFRERADQDRITWSLAHLAGLESIQGEHTPARQLFEECLAHFRQLRNKEGVAWTLFNLAWTLFVAQHDATIVRSLLAESLVLCKELGARDSIASCLDYSGMVALHQGSMVAARSFLEESVALNRGCSHWTWWINPSALSRPISGRFLVMRQSRQAFASQSEAPSECFCEHLPQTPRDMILLPPPGFDASQAEFGNNGQESTSRAVHRRWVLPAAMAGVRCR